MNDSEILQALIDADIAMTGKGYPDARMSFTCERDKWTPERPWRVALYLTSEAGDPKFVGHFGDSQTAIRALDKVVDRVDPRPHRWTRAEVAATLGIAPDYAEAAE